MKYIIALALTISLIGCSSDNTLPENDNPSSWCDILAYGKYEATTSDGVKVMVEYSKSKDGYWQLYEEGFYISYSLANGDEISPIYTTTSMTTLYLFEYESKEIVINKKIELTSPKGISLKINNNVNNNFENNLERISIEYISNNELKLSFPSIQKVILDELGTEVTSKVNEIILKKTCGVDECYDFDPYASFVSFTDHEKGFIEHDLDMTESWKVAEKELMLDYLLRKPEIESMAWGAWNKSLDGIGSVFKLDLNRDDEQDICGYFTHEQDNEKRLVFKIFLNNGVSYDEVYSKNMSKYWGGDEVFFPDELNGKSVVGCSYLDKAGYCLFYNKLKNEIENKYYD
jgi:hypothetical protein